MLAQRQWSPEAAQTYYSKPTYGKDAKANAAIGKAHAAAKELHDFLYPKDD